MKPIKLSIDQIRDKVRQGKGNEETVLVRAVRNTQVPGIAEIKVCGPGEVATTTLDQALRLYDNGSVVLAE